MKKGKKIAKGIIAGFVLLYLGLIAWAYWPQETVPIEKLCSKHDRFVTVDNQRIHYIKAGIEHAGNPVLILVHGFAGSTYTWRKIVPLLSNDYTIYALDLLGFGLSDKPPDGSYYMRSQAMVLLHFMDALAIPSAVLAGHSMGGVIVSYAAIMEPARVKALVLIEPGFYTHGTPAFLKYLFFPFDRLMARQFYTRGFRKKFFTNTFYNKSLITDEVMDNYMVPTRTPHAVDSLAQMMKTVGPRQYVGVTEKISQPTLVVWGSNQKKKEIAMQIKGEIKGSHLAFVNKCGHYVQEEKPYDLVGAMREFLDVLDEENSSSKL